MPIARLSCPPRRCSQRYSQIAPRGSFSLRGVVIERFNMMLAFKREMASKGFLGENLAQPWDLTDPQVVQFLVENLEIEERKEERVSLMETWHRQSQARASRKGSFLKKARASNVLADLPAPAQFGRQV
eukprot:CAMPEP_0169268922 /NCGR_PEP_ID=MMETSP1016-20121227/48116_1 /TAXON_ID=342587 /ORGANISM="Karlodinium micrum, Strain CCMP2283" /LENGTH=128 /DNA_ID=CAMNT_0009353781 /DNA_START=41 /DNA_END=427 /DNA_ORIENTATION=+